MYPTIAHCSKISMSLVILVSVCQLFFQTSPVQAKIQKFPYGATTTVEDVAVHSGPGSRFYMTGSLKKGQKLFVHRHDPGGWYMIAPPPGSFSYIRAEYVKKNEQNHWIITENNVVVRVGSEMNDHREVEQRRLMKGDRVNVLGEVKLEERGRVVKTYRIEPPRGEFRWVKGDYLIPLNEDLRKQHDADPYALPSNGIEFQPEEPNSDTPDLSYPIAKERPQETSTTMQEVKSARIKPAQNSWDTSTGVVANNVDLQAINRDRDILNALDNNFRRMVQQDVAKWKLEDLQHDYRKLQSTTKVQAIANQIELRLNEMQKYFKIKAEFDELNDLISSTDRRDAALAAQETKTSVTAMNEFGLFPESEPVPENQVADLWNGSLPELSDETTFLPNMGPEPTDNNLFPIPDAIGQPTSPQIAQRPTDVENTITPGLPSGGINLPSPAFPPAQTSPEFNPLPQFQGAELPNSMATVPNAGPTLPPEKVANNFVGAGIVAQVPGWQGRGPRHMLVTPQGHFLAYLQPKPGLNLDQYLGHAVGIQGDRQQLANQGQDLIKVSGLSAVRLTPTSRQ